MIFIENNSNDIFFNLALEEYIFEKFKDDDIFMLWINSPVVVIGKHQNLIEEVNMKYCNENNIKIARRLSGGGTVFHDLGNLNYSIITNTKGDTQINFKEFLKPVYKALRNLKIDVSISNRNDLKLYDKKICGHSEFVRKKRVLHHGCILFDTDLINLKGALNVKKKKIISNSAKSVRSEVGNLKELCKLNYDVLDFKKILKNEVCKLFLKNSSYELTCSDIENVNKLSKEKYSTVEWIYGQSPKSTVILDDNKNIKMDISSGKIEKVYGDENLKTLIGKYYTYNDILDKFNNSKLSIYKEKIMNIL